MPPRAQPGKGRRVHGGPRTPPIRLSTARSETVLNRVDPMGTRTVMSSPSSNTVSTTIILDYDAATRKLLNGLTSLFLLQKEEAKEVTYMIHDPSGSVLLAFTFLLRKNMELVYLISWLQICIDHYVNKEGYNYELLLESVGFRYSKPEAGEEADAWLPRLRGQMQTFDIMVDGRMLAGAESVTWDITGSDAVPENMNPMCRYWAEYRDALLMGDWLLKAVVEKPVFKVFTTYYVGGLQKEVGSGHRFMIDSGNYRNPETFFGKNYKEVKEEGKAAGDLFGLSPGVQHQRSTSWYLATPDLNHSGVDQPPLGPQIAREVRSIEAGLRERALGPRPVDNAQEFVSSYVSAEEAKAVLWPDKKKGPIQGLSKTVNITMRGKKHAVEIQPRPAISDDERKTWSKYQKAGGNPQMWAAFPMDHAVYDPDDFPMVKVKPKPVAEDQTKDNVVETVTAEDSTATYSVENTVSDPELLARSLQQEDSGAGFNSSDDDTYFPNRVMRSPERKPSPLNPRHDWGTESKDGNTPLHSNLNYGNVMHRTLIKPSPFRPYPPYNNPAPTHAYRSRYFAGAGAGAGGYEYAPSIARPQSMRGSMMRPDAPPFQHTVSSTALLSTGSTFNAPRFYQPQASTSFNPRVNQIAHSFSDMSLAAGDFENGDRANPNIPKLTFNSEDFGLNNAMHIQPTDLNTDNPNLGQFGNSAGMGITDSNLADYHSHPASFEFHPRPISPVKQSGLNAMASNFHTTSNKQVPVGNYNRNTHQEFIPNTNIPYGSLKPFTRPTSRNSYMGNPLNRYDPRNQSARSDYSSMAKNLDLRTVAAPAPYRGYFPRQGRGPQINLDHSNGGSAMSRWEANQQRHYQNLAMGSHAAQLRQNVYVDQGYNSNGYQQVTQTPNSSLLHRVQDAHLQKTGNTPALSSHNQVNPRNPPFMNNFPSHGRQGSASSSRPRENLSKVGDTQEASTVADMQNLFRRKTPYRKADKHSNNTAKPSNKTPWEYQMERENQIKEDGLEYHMDKITKAVLESKKAASAGSAVLENVRGQARPAQGKAGVGGKIGSVRNVNSKVPELALRQVLGAFGTLETFDIDREKSCASLEYSTPAEFQAAVLANPHKVVGEEVFVVVRQPEDCGCEDTKAATAVGTLAQVTNVIPKVESRVLLDKLSTYGFLTHFEIDRTRNMALIEFSTQGGYLAAAAENPHIINDEEVFVLPRLRKMSKHRKGSKSAGQTVGKVSSKADEGALIAMGATSDIADTITDSEASETAAVAVEKGALPNTPARALQPETPSNPALIPLPNTPAVGSCHGSLGANLAFIKPETGEDGSLNFEFDRPAKVDGHESKSATGSKGQEA